MKAQPIRVIDVVLLGPLMIWGGMQATKKNPLLGAALAVGGLSTITYNAGNYLRLKNERRI